MLTRTVTGPYLEADETSPYEIILFLECLLVYSSHLLMGLPSGVILYGFSIKTLWEFPFSTGCYMSCPSHPHSLDHSNYM
jgi:hypothetical protein